MSQILKFALFFIFFNLISYASESAQTNGRFKIISSPVPDYFKFEKLESSPIGSKIIRIKVSNSYQYYSVDLIEKDLYFNTDTGITGGLYVDNNKFYYLVSEQVSLNSTCAIRPLIGCPFCLRNCDFSVTADNTNWFAVQARKADKYKLSFLKTCGEYENFNTETKECQKCPEGHSWNPSTNKCYKDCSDAKKNMYGWDDGSCTDCSHAKTTADVYKCFCGGLGLGVPNQVTDPGFPNGGKCGRKGACLDGYQFEYTDPECKEDKDPKPDDNSTKPQDPDTPDNPKDPKDPKPNPDGPKPDPDDSNNEFCKKNPKDPKCKNKDNNNTKPKGPGGGGGGDNDGKDKDAKFNPDEFDDGGADKERDGLFDDIKNHLNNNISKLDVISEGVNQFMDNVKGKGFDKVKADIKHKCPITREIPLPNGSSKPVTVDYCDIVSPVSEVTYYAFYIGFAVGGFLLFLKLLLLSF